MPEIFKKIWSYRFRVVLLFCLSFAVHDSRQISPRRQSFSQETVDLVQFNPPQWLNPKRARRVQIRLERILGAYLWRSRVIWHTDLAEFQRICGFYVFACSVPGDRTIHMGPKINSLNFDRVYGHELFHAMHHEKFNYIRMPHWLDEGFADFFAHRLTINYSKFDYDPRYSTDPFEKMRNTFVRFDKERKSPFKLDQSAIVYPDIHKSYQRAEAFVEMIDSKCGAAKVIKNLYQTDIWAVLKNQCGIQHVKSEYYRWLLDQKTCDRNNLPVWGKLDFYRSNRFCYRKFLFI